MTHAAVTDSMAERLQELGGIFADRVRSTPAPGTANVIAETSRRLFEMYYVFS